ncbi:hypothetical protein UA24_08165 [Marinomonas sp. BSi20414]|nr:hypothetical protein [Marinomonas sp. BSi20414]
MGVLITRACVLYAYKLFLFADFVFKLAYDGPLWCKTTALLGKSECYKNKEGFLPEQIPLPLYFLHTKKFLNQVVGDSFTYGFFLF